MRKVYERIELLCRNAKTPHVVAGRLHITIDYERSTKNFVCINLEPDALGPDWYLLPTRADRKWRAKWRAFLSAHVGAVSRILCEHEPESRDALRGPVF